MTGRLTPEADADIARVLKQTRKLFSDGQARIYADIIERGIGMIADDPAAAVHANRDEIAPGERSFHLEHVKNRRNSASHVIYFQVRVAQQGESSVVVIGMLHERMLPKRKLGRVLRALDDEEPEVIRGPAPR